MPYQRLNSAAERALIGKAEQIGDLRDGNVALLQVEPGGAPSYLVGQRVERVTELTQVALQRARAPAELRCHAFQGRVPAAKSLIDDLARALDEGRTPGQLLEQEVRMLGQYLKHAEVRTPGGCVPSRARDGQAGPVGLELDGAGEQALVLGEVHGARRVARHLVGLAPERADLTCRCGTGVGAAEYHHCFDAVR